MEYKLEFLKARTALGLTQKKMGDALGISENHWWRLENGKSQPSKAIVKSVKMLVYLKIKKEFMDGI